MSNSKTGYEKFFKEARKARTSKLEKKKYPLPLMPIFVLSALLGAGLWSMFNMEYLEKMIHKFEIRVLAAAEAEEKAAKNEGTKDKKEEKVASEEGPEKKAKPEEAKSWTPEQLALFSKLEERKETLDRREEDLKKLEEELHEQKVSLEKRFKELESIRNKISSRLEEKVKIDQEKVDKLVEVYSNMKPQNAAKVIEEINEDLAIEVLSKMKKKNAAELLNLLKPEKAQKLSEKFAGYKQ